jgi:hypothetical protein
MTWGRTIPVFVRNSLIAIDKRIIPNTFFSRCKPPWPSILSNNETSMPKMPSKGLPMYKKARKITNETIVALTGSISPDFAFISRITGMEPGISIIANKTIKAAIISTILICIFPDLGAKVGRKNQKT